MLDDVRRLMHSNWRNRARVYAATVAALALSMTVFGFDASNPPEETAGGAMWLAFAAGTLALANRGFSREISAATRRVNEVGVGPRMSEARHNADLLSRSLVRS